MGWLPGTSCRCRPNPYKRVSAGFGVDRRRIGAAEAPDAGPSRAINRRLTPDHIKELFSKAGVIPMCLESPHPTESGELDEGERGNL